MTACAPTDSGIRPQRVPWMPGETSGRSGGSPGIARWRWSWSRTISAATLPGRSPGTWRGGGMIFDYLRDRTRPSRHSVVFPQQRVPRKPQPPSTHLECKKQGLAKGWSMRHV
jgi:hypothetical protein